MSEQLGPFLVDPSVRRVGPGRRLLIGGSPLRLFRLSAAGAALVDRVAEGAEVRATPGVRSLIDRLVDGGALHPCPPPRAGAVATEVTAVVPVRDHAAALERLLGSLMRSHPRPAHLVVVDDGSADPDELAAVVARAAPDEVTLVRTDRPEGPAAARNRGAGRVATELIAFVDADCTVSEHWLGPLLAQLDAPTVGAAAPRVVAADSGSGRLLERYDAVRSPLDLGPVPARVESGTRVSYVPSAALVVRSEELRRLDGFDESLRVGEDVDLIWRAVESGARVRYEPRSVVRHEVRADLVTWCLQRAAYGTSAAALDRRHRGQVAPVICSPWSVAVWALVGFVHPVAGIALVVGTTARLHHRLEDVPFGEVLRLGIGGHLAAGAQMAQAMPSVWWPAAVVASAVSRRVRRLAAAALAVRLFSAVRDSRGSLRARAGFVGLSVLDDAAYGTGVWVGCARERSLRALLPALRTRPSG